MTDIISVSSVSLPAKRKEKLQQMLWHSLMETKGENVAITLVNGDTYCGIFYGIESSNLSSWESIILKYAQKMDNPNISPSRSTRIRTEYIEEMKISLNEFATLSAISIIDNSYKKSLNDSNLHINNKQEDTSLHSFYNKHQNQAIIQNEISLKQQKQLIEQQKQTNIISQILNNKQQTTIAAATHVNLSLFPDDIRAIIEQTNNNMLKHQQTQTNNDNDNNKNFSFNPNAMSFKPQISNINKLHHNNKHINQIHLQQQQPQPPQPQPQQQQLHTQSQAVINPVTQQYVINPYHQYVIHPQQQQRNNNNNQQINNDNIWLHQQQLATAQATPPLITQQQINALSINSPSFIPSYINTSQQQNNNNNNNNNYYYNNNNYY